MVVVVLVVLSRHVLLKGCILEKEKRCVDRILVLLPFLRFLVVWMTAACYDLGIIVNQRKLFFLICKYFYCCISKFLRRFVHLINQINVDDRVSGLRHTQVFRSNWIQLIHASCYKRIYKG